MIAIVGSLEDDIVATVCALLEARGADVVLVDPDAPVEFTVVDSIVCGSLAAQDGRDGDWRDVTAMLMRAMSAVDRTDTAALRARSALALLADRHPGVVVNRPSAAISNMSKPYQLSLIAAAGFTVPHTLVTNVPAEARAFIDECSGQAIFKSVSAVRSIVTQVQADDLDRLELVARCPTQFQAYVPGIDVRVHVVGEQVFASEILTNAVDYRYARRAGEGREIRALALDPELERRCVTLARALDLGFAGIDLRRTPAGDWVCFEVNPSPAFTFYQAHTGQAIGDAVCDLLLGAERPTLDGAPSRRR